MIDETERGLKKNKMLTRLTRVSNHEVGVFLLSRIKT